MIKILFLLTFIPFFGYAAKNSTNQSKITNSTSINDESNQINEISYGIFTFLFAIFAIFLLLGIFCLVEQYLCKNSGKLKLLLKKILRNLRLYKINQRIRQKANRKKRLASPRNSLVF